MANVDHPGAKTTCVNCGAPMQGRFCSECGEKRLRPSDFSFSHLLKELFEGIVHADSRFLRSFWYLIRRPGFLSLEYLRGRRVPYMKPLAFFLIVNLFYFLTIGFNTARTFETPLKLQYMNPYGQVAEKMVETRLAGARVEERKAFEEDFNHQNHNLSKSLLLLLAPMMGLLLWLLHFRRRPYFAENFVVALHLLCLQIVFNMVIGIAFRGGIITNIFGRTPATVEFREVIEPLFWNCLFAYFTFKTVYKEGIGRRLWKAIIFGVLWLPILLCYRFLVFLITLYTI